MSFGFRLVSTRLVPSSRGSTTWRYAGWHLLLALTVAVGLGSSLLPTPTWAQAVLTVNTATDELETAGCGNATGLCSLRGAIDVANATANADPATPDIIRFDIDGPGPHVIPVGRSDYNGRGFAAITEAVVIDGTSEPDYDATNAVPSVVLHDDEDGGYSIYGLQLKDHTGSTVRGLSLTGFTGGSVSAIYVRGGGSHTVVRNRIGERPDGTVYGNNTGVHIENSTNNRIELNRIRSHLEAGILVEESTSTGNRITQNAIYESGTAAIDLGNDGITPNDGSADQDTGPNTLLNTPVIRSTSYTGGQLSVTYEVPAGTFSVPYPLDVEFFLASARAQAERYLGTATYSSSGITTASVPVASLPSPFEIVATATDANGNTSELGIQLPARSDTYTVTTTADSGPGSLRRAIRAANDDASANTIAFDIAGSGPHTITPTAILPKLFGPVTVDGTTEPDYTVGTPAVVLDGSNLTYKYANGLVIESGGSTAIRGLAFTNILPDEPGDGRSSGAGLKLTETDRIIRSSDTFEITGNVFGVRPDGVTAAPNRTGLIIRANYATVGGTSVADRNLISGNRQYGIVVGSDGQRIIGNYLGVAADGVTALGNGSNGLRFSNTGAGGSTTRTRVENNVIAANGQDGIHLHGRRIDVYGNKIGVGSDGTTALGNGSNGILLYYGSNDNRIGGVGTGEGNTIAHNTGNGVFLYDNGRARASTTAIRGNAIYLNRRLGIELGGGGRYDADGNGINRNDAVPDDLFSYVDDSDEGANQQQNYPEITSFNLDPDGGTLTITYSVPSDPAHAEYPVAVDFYEAQFDLGGQPSGFFGSGGGAKSASMTFNARMASAEPEPSAKTAYTGGGRITEVLQIPLGEGARYLTTDTYTEADYRNGDGAKTVTLPLEQIPDEAGSWVIGTATDSNQNTSEFSFPFYVYSWSAGGSISLTNSSRATLEKASSDPARHRFTSYDVAVDPSYTEQEWTLAVDRTLAAPSGALPSGRELATYGSWTLTPEDPTVGFAVEVCFAFNDLTRARSDIDFTALEIWRRPDAQTAWANVADVPTVTLSLNPANSIYPPNEVCASSLSSLGEFVVIAAPGALPVELARFEVQHGDTGARLAWNTASETNNAGFHVERAVDGASFTDLGFVDGRGTTDTPQSYRFVDGRLPYAADSLTYRLRQVDLDGTATLTDEVVLRLGTPDRLELHTPYPNPTHGPVTLAYGLSKGATVDIGVYNVLGQRVLTLVEGPQAAGRVEKMIDASRFSSGTYFIRLLADDQMRTTRMMVVR